MNVHSIDSIAGGWGGQHDGSQCTTVWRDPGKSARLTNIWSWSCRRWGQAPEDRRSLPLAKAGGPVSTTCLRRSKATRG